jgi:uncharacterized protein YndB with AHSA1/START domain
VGDKDFVLELEFAVPAERLYAQFSTDAGVQHWWTTACAIEKRVGGTAQFHFEEDGFTPLMKIMRLEMHKCVEWKVINARHPDKFAYKNPHDWEGQRIRFDIEPDGLDKSKLKFTHEGLMGVESGERCAKAWRHFLGVSLREYFETGKGRPAGA